MKGEGSPGAEHETQEHRREGIHQQWHFIDELDEADRAIMVHVEVFLRRGLGIKLGPIVIQSNYFMDTQGRGEWV